jgi:hypothetical protein
MMPIIHGATTDHSWVEDSKRHGSGLGRHWSSRKETGGSARDLECYMLHFGLCDSTWDIARQRHGCT